MLGPTDTRNRDAGATRSAISMLIDGLLSPFASSHTICPIQNLLHALLADGTSSLSDEGNLPGTVTKLHLLDTSRTSGFIGHISQQLPEQSQDLALANIHQMLLLPSFLPDL